MTTKQSSSPLKTWRCKECGQEAFGFDSKAPSSISWSDGHTCIFKPVQEEVKEGE